MSDLARLSFTLPAPAGLVRISLASPGGAVYSDDVVDLTPEDAAGFAAKLLVLSALASKEPVGMVEVIAERIRWMLDSVGRSEALLNTTGAEADALTSGNSGFVPSNEEEERQRPADEDLAPETCAACGVDLGTWQKVAEHGRVGCKGFDTGEVPCPDCERKFATTGGLGVHRAHAHPGSRSEPPEGTITCDDCDGRFQNRAGLSAHRRMKHGSASDASRGAFPCADCGVRFRSLGGLTSHRTGSHPPPVTSLVDRIQADEPEPDDEPARAAAEPEHRLADKLQKGYEHATRCSCGWQSDWFNYPSPAAVALREHVDEVAA